MDLMDCQSFLLFKEKTIETDKLIKKCQALQSQLEMVQKDQAKQQMELRLMENENALLRSAKRKCEAEFHQKMGTLKAYENTIKQCTAKINELEKVHDRDAALIKTLQTERDTAVSENRKVSSSRNRSLKARSKQTQTELLVHMSDDSKIIIPSFQLNCRQRRRRSSQALSRSTDNEARELICRTPTIILPPAERASTPKSSCSEAEGSSGGEDITENEMPWLTEITEQPAVTPLHNVTHSESELDDFNDNFLLPYNTMDMSISPLPPTPSMNLDNGTPNKIDTSLDTSTQSDHHTSDNGLLKECHLFSDSSVVPDDGNERVEESTLISSHQLSDYSEDVVVATNSAKSLLEEAAGLQGSSAFTKDSHESSSGVIGILDNGSCNEEACKSSTLHAYESTSLAASTSAEASILNTPKSLVTLSSGKLSDRPITVPIFVSHVPAGLTSPKALRSKLQGFGTGNKDKRTYPSFLVDSHREPTVDTTFSKDKCNHTQKKQTGSLNRRSSPQLDMYSSSIAERTRSHASKNSHGTLPMVTKKAERQLSKLEITMNAFKTLQNDDGLQNHDTSEKSILSENRVKKDSGKRKRSLKQPRSDLKRKRYNASNYQQPSKAVYAILDESFDQPTQLAAERASKNGDEIKQSSQVASNQNGGKLDKSEGEMNESDKSDGELDSSYGNESGDNLEGDKNRVFDEPKGENNGTAVEKNKEGKSEGKHKEDRNVDKLVETQENKNEDENMDEEVLELDKIEGKEDGTDEHKKQVSKKEVREVEIKQKKFVLKESQCAVENKEEKLQKEDEDELEEERSEVENIELEEERSEVENKEEKLQKEDEGELEEERSEVENIELEEERSEVENKEEKLQKEDEGELEEERSEVENIELEEERSEVENKEEKLQKEDEGELEEERSEVENIELKEERSEVENKEEKLQKEDESELEEERSEKNLEERSERELEDNSKVENKEENLERGRELEARSEVEDIGDKLHVTDESDGELGDIINMENENEEELKANKNEVETKEKLQEDKNEEVLKDNRNGIEEESEDKNEKDKENKSDGELDSEEDEPSNQTPEPTIYASPGKKEGLFLKNKPTNELTMSATSSNIDDTVLDPPRSLLKETNLPGWLEWTINEEEKASNTIQHSFIKEQKRKRAKNKRMKSQAQRTMNYLLANLERLLLKTLKFEKVLDMFSDPCNVDSTSEFANALAKFIVEALHPSFENVASKLAERCNKAISHNAKIFPHYKPLDENFHPVMLTFESRIVAMLMVIDKHNPKLDNVMGCVADTLRCKLFMSLEDNHIDVHKQCSLIRVITGISRAVGKIDFIQRLCLDLISLCRPLKISQLPLLQAVAGVWPLVLARKEDVKLYGLKEVIPEGLEPQIVSHTVEVTTCYLISKQDSQAFSHLLFKTFVSFCKWQQLSSEASMHSLATALVKILTSSPNVTLTSYDITNQGKWISPQLSPTTHMCITCLAVIGRYLGWKWISDNLIREQLWPLLQKWSRKAMGQEVPEAVITAITQLIGLVGKQGVLHDPTCQSVRQLQKMLSSLLQRAHDSPEVTLSIQLAVAESLISLCHPSQLPVAKEILQNWLTGIKTHHPYAAHTIWEEFAPRVWNMRTVTNKSTSDEKTY